MHARPNQHSEAIANRDSHSHRRPSTGPNAAATRCLTNSVPDDLPAAGDPPRDKPLPYVAAGGGL